ncbi:MAG: PilZ domain-containing protein, partial [Cyanobacteria bacterium J06621_15]
VAKGKHISDEEFKGLFIKLSLDGAELSTTESLEAFSNIQIQLYVENEQLNQQIIHAKVVKILKDHENNYRLRFTVLPTEIKSWFKEIGNW